MIVGMINYLEQNEKIRSDYFPKSQPHRKKLGILSINSYPFQCKIVNISKYFFIPYFVNFDEKLGFILFNDYKPSLFIFFPISEQSLNRSTFYITINK